MPATRTKRTPAPAKRKVVHTRQVVSAARAASKAAIKKAFSLNLAVTVVENGWIVQKFPSGKVVKVKRVSLTAASKNRKKAG